MDFPVLFIQFLGGIVFVLSGYIILHHFRAWRSRDERTRLLPLHVWLIAVSYNLLVISHMLRVPRTDLAFAFGSTALLVGIYSLWVMVKLQRKHSR